VRQSRYQELTELLLAGVADGTFPLGGKLPTEQQLCTQHGLARGTVRLAIGRLEQLGLIERRPGAGTRVVASRPISQYQPVAQSVDDITALARETKLLRPRIEEVVLDTAAARRLRTRPGRPWLIVEGVRVWRGRDQSPLCWSEHWLRGDQPRDKFLHADLTAADVTMTSIEQTISAAVLDEPRARALGAKAGSAALVVTRRHRERGGSLISVGVHTHPADRYSITMRVDGVVPAAATPTR
jgi:GntR family transcriptional regulator